MKCKQISNKNCQSRDEMGNVFRFRKPYLKLTALGSPSTGQNKRHSKTKQTTFYVFFFGDFLFVARKIISGSPIFVICLKIEKGE